MSFGFNSSRGADAHHLLDLNLSNNAAVYDPQRQRFAITTSAAASHSPVSHTSPGAVDFTVSSTSLIPHTQHQQKNHIFQRQPQQTQHQQIHHQTQQIPLGLTPSALATMMPSQNWQMGLDMAAVTSVPSPTSSNDEQQHQQQLQHPQAGSPHHVSQSGSQCSSPHSQHSPHSSHHSPLTFSASLSPLPDWAIHQQSPPMPHSNSPQMQHPQIPVSMPSNDAQFINDTALLGFSAFPTNFNTAPLGLIPTSQAALATSIAMEQFNNMPAMEDPLQWSNIGVQPWAGGLGGSLQLSPMPRMPSVGSGSPNSAYLEVVSIPGSNPSITGENWGMVDWNANLMQQNAAIFNPGQTLHLGSPSDSDSLGAAFSTIDEFPVTSYSPTGSDHHDGSSPGSHGQGCFHEHPHGMHMEAHHVHVSHHGHNHSHSTDMSPTVATPMPIKTPAPPTARSSPQSRSSGKGSGVISSSPVSSTVVRRNSGIRKSPVSKPKVVRRTSTGRKDGTGEKKVGRRKGPLLPEQRKQASEIRKLRACLRCKFLKKTCDKGEPCTGCQPSHARLWQVPCTRIDIKDIGYFMKDWKADYARHLDQGVSVYNVKGFSSVETLMWITHGYGFALPVMVREVFVADDDCFQVDWVENNPPETEHVSYQVRTERLDLGAGGINPAVVSEYLDKHIDERFQEFVDDYFEGTPFITEILKTAHRYYKKEQSPVIRKALKLVMAYNLTMHITMIENPAAEHEFEGTIDDEDSKFYGRTVAPVMINFQIKCAMADMWRELQKDVLEELSQLYSSVYSGERLKNWPTIFMLASILLAVWEEMQFDCHYRVPDPAAVNKFCNDMETTPVGVIVGLFHAISQKLPAFIDWDTRKHGHILNNNPAVCEALTEVREHVIKHESYLRTRPDAKFNPNDFDSLSNKFLSKLVIKAN